MKRELKEEKHVIICFSQVNKKTIKITVGGLAAEVIKQKRP